MAAVAALSFIPCLAFVRITVADFPHGSATSSPCRR